MSTEISTRCPACGGLNRSNSEWCGQCFTPLAPAADGPRAPLKGGPETAGAESTQPAGSGERRVGPFQPVDIGERRAGAGAKGGLFSVDKGGGVSWECSSCATGNPLETDDCTACGTSFVATMKPAEPKGPERDPGTAAMLSLFMPGAGHGYLGMWGQAVARGILGLWVSGIVLIAGLQEGAGSGLIAIVFGAASFGLWAVTAHDAYQEAIHRSGAVILKGRAFLYTVLGLLAILLCMLVVSGLRASTA